MCIRDRLYIDAKELREKGSIVLLQDGDLLVAINDEMIKVLNDVENPKTDTKEKREINVKFTIVPNYSRTGIALEADVSTKLAKKKIMSLSLGLEKAIDDEGHLLAYNLKEECGEAEGQQDIDGNEVARDAITLPYRTQAIDAEFKDKDEDECAETDDFNDVHSDVVIDEDTGEVLEPKADLDDFPEPNEQDI